LLKRRSLLLLRLNTSQNMAFLKSLATLHDILGVAFIQYGATRDWIFEDEAGRFTYQPKGCIRTNDAEQMRIAVLSHLGIANAPAWLFAKELAYGEVRPVLGKFAQPKPIFALRPGGRRLAAKVQVFMDFMEEILARELAAAATKPSRPSRTPRRKPQGRGGNPASPSAARPD
jgi:DNA-binding transcriptional LysR family regulator